MSLSKITLINMNKEKIKYINTNNDFIKLANELDNVCLI